MSLNYINLFKLINRNTFITSRLGTFIEVYIVLTPL